MIVELFTDYPNRKNRVFHVFANLNVFEYFKNSQKAELRLLFDTLYTIVIYDFVAIETVRSSFSCYKHVNELLCTVTMITNQWILFVVHL